MKISKLILIFISIFNFIYSGPVVGAAACTACCASVHLPDAFFMPFYLGMVGKCVTSCLTSLVGISLSSTEPRELPCVIAEKLISFAPSA